MDALTPAAELPLAAERGPTCDAQNVLAFTGQPAAEDPPSDDFDWSSEAVITPEQLAVAAYFNPAGDLVIRQERAWYQEDDSVVIVHRGNVASFIDKLTDVLGIPGAP